MKLISWQHALLSQSGYRIRAHEAKSGQKVLAGILNFWFTAVVFKIFVIYDQIWNKKSEFQIPAKRLHLGLASWIRFWNLRFWRVERIMCEHCWIVSILFTPIVWLELIAEFWREFKILICCVNLNFGYVLVKVKVSEIKSRKIIWKKRILWLNSSPGKLLQLISRKLIWKTR